MKCPKCGSTKIVKIIYGLLTLRGRKESTEGKAHWAGCNWTKGKPDLHCKACGHEFSEEKKVRMTRTRSEASRAAWAKHRDKIMAGMKKAAEKKSKKPKS